MLEVPKPPDSLAFWADRRAPSPLLEKGRLPLPGDDSRLYLSQLPHKMMFVPWPSLITSSRVASVRSQYR